MKGISNIRKIDTMSNKSDMKYLNNHHSLNKSISSSRLVINPNQI